MSKDITMKCLCRKTFLCAPYAYTWENSAEKKDVNYV